MSEREINVLFLNGIRDSGVVDIVQATPTGKLIFSTAGSCNVAGFLPPEQVSVTRFALDHHARQDIDLGFVLRHDVVFCEIADADSHATALRKARNLFRLTGDRIPWVNDPNRVATTRRDLMAPLLADLPGVVSPRTLRVEPSSAADLQSAITSAGFRLPVLIRPAGSHGGQHLVRIDDLAALNPLDLARYRQALVTEFVDTAEDGLYAKYRFAVVGGEAFLRHVIFSDHWCIHSESRRFMAQHPALQAREAQLLDTFHTGLKPRTRDAVQRIYERTGLDYFGIDFTLHGDRLLLFEVNANMNILNNNQPLPNRWEQPIDDMREKIIGLLHERAGQRVPGQVTQTSATGSGQP